MAVGNSGANLTNHEEAVIARLWENSGHGTRREDIEAAYLAGKRANAAPIVGDYFIHKTSGAMFTAIRTGVEVVPGAGPSAGVIVYPSQPRR